MRVTIDINGKTVSEEVEDRTLLVHFVRDVAGLTATNVGCDTTSCGACTVLLDGESVKSCTMLAAQAEGHTVTTLEGLGEQTEQTEATETGERRETEHPLRRAFREQHGLQCGFCTPGMIMAAASLLDQNPRPTRDEVREGLEGNLCRCTGYQNIVNAVIDASGQEVQK